MSGHQPYPLGLATLKGFLFSASPELLTVHNVSGLYSRAKDDPVVGYGRPLDGGSAAALMAAHGSHVLLTLTLAPNTSP